MTDKLLECREAFENLLPIIQNGLNEYAQMLLQSHTRGDYNFLCTKIITAVWQASRAAFAAELVRRLDTLNPYDGEYAGIWKNEAIATIRQMAGEE